jgi:hypothetical protein
MLTWARSARLREDVCGADQFRKSTEMLEARDGIEPPARALQALPLANSGTAPQDVRKLAERVCHFFSCEGVTKGEDESHDDPSTWILHGNLAAAPSFLYFHSQGPHKSMPHNSLRDPAIFALIAGE